MGLIEDILKAKDSGVTELKLNDCNQTTVKIPAEIGELRDLKSLDIFCIYVTELPPEIGLLANLEILVFYDAEILKYIQPELFSLPPEIGLLENLKELRLFCPKVKELPRELGRLKKLEKVEILFGGKYTDKMPFDTNQIIRMEEFQVRTNSVSPIRFIAAAKKSVYAGLYK